YPGSRRAIFLAALVALDAARVVVLGLALLPGELHAVDAAVALVQHFQVVEHPAGDARAAGGVRPDPVEIRRYDLLFRLGVRACGAERQERRAAGCNEA